MLGKPALVISDLCGENARALSVEVALVTNWNSLKLRFHEK